MKTIPEVGKLVEGEAKRDAIHVAVIPMVAGERLDPGQHVNVDDGEARRWGVTVGVVDPFLESRVERNETFWLFLYPQSITSLRHEWTHPAFPEHNVEIVSSQEWMEAFASGHTDPYMCDREYTADDVIIAATNFLESDERHCQRGDETLQDALGRDSDKRIFWMHYQNITGNKVPEEYMTEQPFTCSC